MVPIHPYYALLSEDAQSAVNIRLLTGSRMPTGSMLGDYVVQKSRPLWGCEDTPATASWISSASSWTSCTSGGSSSSGGTEGSGGAFGIFLLLGFFAAASGLFGSHSSSNNYDTLSAALAGAPTQTRPLSSSNPNGTEAADQGRIVEPTRGAAAKPPVTTTTASVVARQFLGYAIVNPPGVNLRPCPGTDCQAIVALRSGSQLTITGIGSRRWLEVDAVDEQGAPVHGYVSSPHVTTDQENAHFGVAPPRPASRIMIPYARTAWTTAKYATVYGYAHVWACAVMEGCWIQATLPPGFAVQILEIRGDGWTEISTSRFGQLLRGYIRTEFLSSNSWRG